MMQSTKRKAALLSASSLLALTLVASAAHAQTDCVLGTDGCDRPDAGDVVVMPLGEATEQEPVSRPMGAQGFAMSVDGQAATGDPSVIDQVRKQDIALSDAQIQVRFDGLEAERRLDIEIAGSAQPAGETVQIQSRLNYPAFVKRSELRVYDRAKPAGGMLRVYAIDPNGQTSIPMPPGDDIVVVHRVYDAMGRYDETSPVSLMRHDAQDLSPAADTEEGSTRLAVQNIPVQGGAVTVFGQGLSQGARVNTLDTTVAVDPDGSFAVQRILPPGSYAIAVGVEGAGNDVTLTRDVTIKKSDWFYVAQADVTALAKETGSADQDIITKGRLAYYVKGRTANQWQITSSADTREGDLDTLLRDLDKRDPQSIVSRMEDDLAYPVYGDDSKIALDAPTSGKVYLRAERDGSSVTWGNFKGGITESEYIRNDRKYYGAQGIYASPAQTTLGAPRTRAEVYASLPENAQGRDVFRGTGGSVYFLQRSDISVGSESVSVEIVDPDTNRVVERRALVAGQDYDVNYVQGLVVLSDPLSGSTGRGIVVGSPGGDYVVNLVVQYEYAPDAADTDNYATGGRIENWVTDSLRIGVTGASGKTDAGRQQATGADIRLQSGENTFVEVEHAQSAGPGYNTGFSANGGLETFNTFTGAGDGEATRVKGAADLAELGLGRDVDISGYWESRGKGFATPEYTTEADEELWGLALSAKQSDRTDLKLALDSYSNALGVQTDDYSAEVEQKLTETYSLGLGVEHTNRVAATAADTGSRTDVAARLTITPSKDFKWWLLGQTTANRSGGLGANDRVGIGTAFALTDNWAAEAEVSDGSLGVAGRAMLRYDQKNGNTAYLGYELDPDRTLAGQSAVGRDDGRVVSGATRKLGENVDLVAENTYDMFGRERSLTSSYGVDYARTEHLRYSASYEMGRLQDIGSDFDRDAVSIGVSYSDDTAWDSSGRIEFRRDRGATGGTAKDADTIVLSAKTTYTLDDESRLMASLRAVNTDSVAATSPEGDYTKLTFGYAHRPILNDRLNVLVNYTYLNDMYGQQVDGSAAAGAVQISHVFSAEANYDIGQAWTVGAKIGLRLSESAASAGQSLSENDAGLFVLNGRYRLTHNWDVLLEGRSLTAKQAGMTEYSMLGAAYRDLSNNVKLGAGYNMGTFSDDLTDLTQDDKGLFVNLVAKF